MDLADLTLAELIAVDVIPDGDAASDTRRWRADYNYVRVDFDGYRDGTTDISQAQLLGPPRGGTFPVLEARIKTQLAIKRNIEDLLEAERLRVMVESLGAVCHHISQPMTSVMGNLGLLKESLASDDVATRAKLQDILEWTDEVRSLLHQLNALRAYRSTPYLSNADILDIGTG